MAPRAGEERREGEREEEPEEEREEEHWTKQAARSRCNSRAPAHVGEQPRELRLIRACSGACMHERPHRPRVMSAGGRGTATRLGELPVVRVRLGLSPTRQGGKLRPCCAVGSSAPLLCGLGWRALLRACVCAGPVHRQCSSAAHRRLGGWEGGLGAGWARSTAQLCPPRSLPPVAAPPHAAARTA
jgi:hypothetical protein